MIIRKLLYVRKTSVVRSGGRKFSFIAYSIIKKDNLYGLGIGKSSDIYKSIDKSYLHALLKLNLLYSSTTIINKFLSYKLGKTIVNIYSPNYHIGLIAGSYSRIIFNFIGINNVYCSILGTRVKYNIIIATFNALINE